jgi:hypothetical protein
MRTHEPDDPFLLDPRAQLEKSLIEEYLHGLGLSLAGLHELPEIEARRLMVEASIYASTHLTVIEDRARFVREMHGMAPPLS